MHKDFTLPDLQAAMDLLEGGGQLQVSHDDILRLFGGNDVAQDRLSRFARGHRCLVIRTGNGVTFRRIPHPVVTERTYE